MEAQSQMKMRKWPLSAPIWHIHEEERAWHKKKVFIKRREERRCYKCSSQDHLIIECPHNDEEKKENKRDKDDKKMAFKKSHAHRVEWDSDASTSDNENDYDDKKSKKEESTCKHYCQQVLNLGDPSCTHASWPRVLRYTIQWEWQWEWKWWWREAL